MFTSPKHSFVILLVLCSITISTACKPSPKPQLPAFACNTDCEKYNKTVCNNLVAVAARQSYSLKKAFESESVAQRQFASRSCDISGSVWNQARINLTTEIWVAENCPPKTSVHCNIKVMQTGLSCIAYAKLFECTLERIHIAYGNPTSCLEDWQHVSWSKVVGLVGEFASSLDHLYESGSPLSPRKSYWNKITSDLAVLKKTLQYMGLAPVVYNGCSLSVPHMDIDYVDHHVGAYSADDGFSLIQATTTEKAIQIKTTTQKADEVTTTTVEPLLCGSEECYSDSDEDVSPRICTLMALVVNRASDLVLNLSIELRHQLRLLPQVAPVCHVDIPKWTYLSESLMKKLRRSGSPSCRLKLPSEDATCAAVVKLMECALRHMAFAFRKTSAESFPCELNRTWLLVWEDLYRLFYPLDYVYNSVLTERKSQWDVIKSSILELKKNLSIDVYCPGCYSFLLYGSAETVYLTQEDDYDETWFIMTTEDE